VITSPLPAGHVVSHTVWMGYGEHVIKFDRIADTTLNMPVLSQSTFSVTPTLAEKGDLLTYTLRVSNTGVVDALVTATNALPDSLALVPATLQASSGITQTDGRAIAWTVPVSVGEAAALTYTALITQVPSGFVVHNRATLDDGLGHLLSLDAPAMIKGLPLYLPIILK
jgi:uncharacterized repeat protein (TIGR01451 family)